MVPTKASTQAAAIEDIHSKQREIGIDTWREKANSFFAKLSPHDPRFDGTIDITHSDGSEFKVRQAFAASLDGYILVFSKHVGMLIFKKGDLKFHKSDYLEEWKLDENGEPIIP